MTGRGQPDGSSAIRSRISIHLSKTTPTEKSAFCNCEKAIEREVEIYRKKAQSVGVHHGVRPANVVSLNAQFAANVKEQQASDGMLDQVALQSVLAALAFALQETHD